MNSFRVYVGLTYIFHIIPEEIKQFNIQLGFDYFATQFGGGTLHHLWLIILNLQEMKLMFVIIFFQQALNLVNGIKRIEFVLYLHFRKKYSRRVL